MKKTKVELCRSLNDFSFFPDGLFYRIVNRTTKWCIDNSGKEPYCLLKTLARFFLDDEHDFVLEMAPRKFHRIKVPCFKFFKN